jgi:enoyl-CoA hydratase/carnithine racemase
MLNKNFFNNNMHKTIQIPNVLNPESIHDLNQQLAVLENEQTRFIVLQGDETIFCNGLDLRWVANNTTGSYSEGMQAYAHFLKKLQTINAVTIAVVKGKTSGGGMGIVCACDVVLATNKAEFSLPEGLFGLIPGMILPALLNKMAPQHIKKMVLAPKTYSVDMAEKWDIVDEIISNENTDAKLNELVQSMKSCKQNSVGDLKNLLYNATYQKDELAQRGMDILKERLNQEDIKERLQDIVAFMED